MWYRISLLELVKSASTSQNTDKKIFGRNELKFVEMPAYLDVQLDLIEETFQLETDFAEGVHVFLSLLIFTFSQVVTFSIRLIVTTLRSARTKALDSLPLSLHYNSHIFHLPGISYF